MSKEGENKAATLAYAIDLEESSFVEKLFRFYPPVESFIIIIIIPW